MRCHIVWCAMPCIFYQELHHAKSLCDACCVVHHAHGRFAGDWLSGVTPWPGPRPDHARSTSARGARDAPRAGARSGSAVRKKGIVVKFFSYSCIKHTAELMFSNAGDAGRELLLTVSDT